MCLGIPGEVIETYSEHDMLMAKVDFGGVFKRVCLQHTPEAKRGDFVIVHVGFSLQVIDPEEAQRVFQFLKDMGDLQELNHGETLVAPDQRDSTFSLMKGHHEISR